MAMCTRYVQHYVIKFVSDLQQVDGFLRVLRFPPPVKTGRYDITKILLVESAVKHHNHHEYILHYTSNSVLPIE